GDGNPKQTIGRDIAKVCNLIRWLVTGIKSTIIPLKNFTWQKEMSPMQNGKGPVFRSLKKSGQADDRCHLGGRRGASYLKIEQVLRLRRVMDVLLRRKSSCTQLILQ
ncbi:hypothetical protein DYD21_20375, partial [Rhodohalobacter sp. SW132]|uniref:hypothetical protein n=1 Tax=Rhodohalobacter sp. SW132 TaxID=2293433 RepID=UPI000E388505